MLDDNTYLNCLLENLNRKIDKLDEKAEKIQDMIIRPRIFFTAGSVLIMCFSFLFLGHFDLHEKVSNNSIHINNLIENSSLQKTRIYENDKTGTTTYTEYYHKDKKYGYEHPPTTNALINKIEDKYRKMREMKAKKNGIINEVKDS